MHFAASVFVIGSTAMSSMTPIMVFMIGPIVLDDPEDCRKQAAVKRD